ncbi:MAG: hypothetical protein JWP00_2205 [Chloroflexi bacterium]|jgi:predicted ribosomally synthesized peptide with nif11-like leader|nr:hypothetical protein [Chloroflexota bacterium]
MSTVETSTFTQFIQTAATDPQLTNKLKTLQPGDINGLLAIAAGAGYPMSQSELLTGAEQDQALEDPNEALSDNELDMVTGGNAKGVYLAVKWFVKSLLGLN